MSGSGQTVAEETYAEVIETVQEIEPATAEEIIENCGSSNTTVRIALREARDGEDIFDRVQHQLYGKGQREIYATESETLENADPWY